MRLIKIPITDIMEYGEVKEFLELIGWTGVELRFNLDTPNFGIMVLRNLQYITGNLERAVHGVDEDLTITPGRFLKLTELQVKTLLDTDNYVE
jgi:hypothetical protein